MDIKIVITAVVLLFARPTFALIGEDAVLLFELVTTTASQLNELEKLVTNAEKYTAKMQRYNELIQDEFYKAERIAYLAEELVAKKEIKNLGDLNYAIRELKYNIVELKELMREYAIIRNVEQQVAKEVKIKKKLNDQNVDFHLANTSFRIKKPLNNTTWNG